MAKPEVGDVITLKDPEESLGLEYTDKAKVLAVFDSLDESWDPWGESAWAQTDHNAIVGKVGEWYVIVEIDEGETFSLGSYEVVE